MYKSFEEEKEYLKNTLDRFDDIISDTELKLKALPRMYGDNPALLSNLMSGLEHRYALLKKTKNKPYFARIDFKDNEEEKKKYAILEKLVFMMMTIRL